MYEVWLYWKLIGRYETLEQALDACEGKYDATISGPWTTDE